MSTLARLKVWVTGDTLTASDLNGEFNNIVNDYNGSVNSSNIGTLTGTLTMTMSANSDVININKSGSGAGNCLDLTNAGTDPTIAVTNSSTGGVLSATANSVTTGDVVSITANGVTTGEVLKISSNSADTSSRNVVEIIQDHASASSAIGLRVQQDADAPTLRLASSATAADAVDFATTAQTTGNIIDIPSADSLTTGSILNLVSNSTSASTRSLVFIKNDSTSADAATPLEIVNDGDVRCLAISATEAAYASNGILVDVTRTGNTAFSYIMCRANATADPEFNLQGTGAGLSDIAWATPADYAEFFECQAPNGIAPGYFVTYAFDQSPLIKRADDGDEVIGITTEKSAFVGDTAWNRWKQKYLKTEFGGDVLDQDGNRVQNPAWDATQQYTPRSERPEWKTVGMLGKLFVRCSEDITSTYVKVGLDGHAVNAKKSDNCAMWRVIEVVRQKSDDPDNKGYGVVRILFK